MCLLQEAKDPCASGRKKKVRILPFVFVYHTTKNKKNARPTRYTKKMQTQQQSRLRQFAQQLGPLDLSFKQRRRQRIPKQEERDAAAATLDGGDWSVVDAAVTSRFSELVVSEKSDPASSAAASNQCGVM